MAESKRWSRFLIIWALILLLLGFAGCFVLYRFLDVYEQTRTELVMDKLLETMSTDDLIREASQNVRLEVSSFENAEELYADFISAIDTSKSLSYRLDNRRSTGAQQVYQIRCGSSPLCMALLSPDSKSLGFGRQLWKVQEIQAAPITETLSSVRLQIDAQAGQQLSLNGQPLTEQYITENDIAIQNLTELEQRYQPVPTLVRYEIGPLYGEISLTDGNGAVLSPLESSTGSVLYYNTLSRNHSLRIQAPDDLRIIVGGAELTRSEARSIDSGVLNGLEPYTGGAEYKTLSYRFENLCSNPEVHAYDQSGRELAPLASSENAYIFFHDSEPDAKLEYQPIAENFFTAYMNYSAHAYDITLFYNLLNQILPGTELFNYISTTQDTMIWAGSSTDVGELQYENFHRISPTCFVCTVVYRIDRTSIYWNGQESTTQEGAYEISFVSSSGRWYAAAMNIISL